MFLIIETSPANHQAWLVMRGEHDREFARRVKRGAGADLTASGATKIAGSLNFKDKYAPDVTIREAQPGRITSPAELERMGPVAPPKHFASVSPRGRFSRGTDKWPIYAKALAGAPRNRDGSGPDRSRARITGGAFWPSSGAMTSTPPLPVCCRKVRRRGRTEKATRCTPPARPLLPSNAGSSRKRFDRPSSRGADLSPARARACVAG